MPKELQYRYPELPAWQELSPHARHPAVAWIALVPLFVAVTLVFFRG